MTPHACCASRAIARGWGSSSSRTRPSSRQRRSARACSQTVSRRARRRRAEARARRTRRSRVTRGAGALGVLEALSPQLDYRRELAAARARAAPRRTARRGSCCWPRLLLDGAAELDERSRRSRLRDCSTASSSRAGERDRVIAAVRRQPRRSRSRLAVAGSPASVHAAVAGRTLEAVALAGALEQPPAAAAAAAHSWLARLRHVRLQITGDDLLAAGVPAGAARSGGGSSAVLALQARRRARAGRARPSCQAALERGRVVSEPICRAARRRPCAVQRPRATATCRASAALDASTATRRASACAQRSASRGSRAATRSTARRCSA